MLSCGCWVAPLVVYCLQNTLLSPTAERCGLAGFYLAKLTRVSTGGKREQRCCLAKRMRRGRIDSITIRDEKRKFISDFRDVVFAVNNNVVGAKVAGCFPQLR